MATNYRDDPDRELTESTRVVADPTLETTPPSSPSSSFSSAHAGLLGKSPVPIPTFRIVKRAKPVLLLSPSVRRSERIMDSAPSPVAHDGRYARLVHSIGRSSLQAREDALEAVQRMRFAASTKRQQIGLSWAAAAAEALPAAAPTRRSFFTENNGLETSASEAPKRKQKANASIQKAQLSGLALTLTSMTRHDVARLAEAARDLGATVFDDNLAPTAEGRFQRFTHVVVGGRQRRTLKVLAGIATGAWVVNQGWLERCIERRSRIDERAHELVDRFPGCYISRTRNKRALEGKSVLVAGSTVPEQSFIVALVISSGGRCVESVRECDYVVAAPPELVKFAAKLKDRAMSETQFLDRIEAAQIFT